MERTYFIYQIFFKGHIYVGSTNNLGNRQNQHRSNCFNMLQKEFSYKVYKTLRNCGIKREDINLQILEMTDKITKKECDLIERKWMDLLKADLNTTVPGRTKKECNVINYKKNKEYLSKKHREYRENNRESINKKAKEYREKKKSKLNPIFVPITIITTNT